MTKPTVSFVSLGCPKNLVDSEKMLGLLAEAGCPIVAEDAGPADVMVVNTCGFLAAARDEALQVLQEAAEKKRNGQIKRLVVAGCFAQRDGQRLLAKVPEIDAIVGVNHRRDIVRAVVAKKRQNAKTPKRQDGKKSKSQKVKMSRGVGDRLALSTQSSVLGTQQTTGETPDARSADGADLFLGDYRPASWIGANRSDRARLRLTPGHYAYLRISEGCDQECTFCTIPTIRGPLHSKHSDEILAEARELIDDGVAELVLIGQDTTSYGTDLGDGVGLAGLLRSLNSLDGLRWIRLMYAYPTDFTDQMIDAIAECDRVVKYVDLPLQHINDRILRAMHRRVTREQTEALLDRLRRRIPGLAVRTTLIAGFPGETDAEFGELQDFVHDFGFEAMGVFPYSNEPHTPAYRMSDQLPPKVIEDRVEALMLTQQPIAFAKAAARVGQTFDVLIDAPGPDGGYLARHAGQAPEVDSVVHIRDDRHLPGDLLTVCCVDSKDYDLIAEPVPG